MENKMTITEMVEKCYSNAVTLGWAEKPVPIPEQIALVHSEASEALEAFRNHEPITWTDEHNKPQGVGSEFADILIRIGHYSKLNGIDLEYEVSRKLEFNLTRGHRHGGKAI
jgi:NTP pyrophosphatase (non-canonical NTP hydrolase)